MAALRRNTVSEVKVGVACLFARMARHPRRVQAAVGALLVAVLSLTLVLAVQLNRAPAAEASDGRFHPCAHGDHWVWDGYRWNYLHWHYHHYHSDGHYHHWHNHTNGYWFEVRVSC